MAFDPQAWKDDDGMTYIAVATDACNSTTRTMPCVSGSSMYLWRAPSLFSPEAEWESLYVTTPTPLSTSFFLVGVDVFGSSTLD